MEIHNLNPELKTFLKALQKLGYPNTTPDVPTIAKAISYPLDNFVIDLVNEIGEEKTKDFIRKTFESLGLMSNTGMKIDLDDTGEYGSYIYLKIHDFDIVLDEPDEPIWIHYSYGDNLLIHDGVEKTLEDIWDEADMGDMGEVSDYIDEIGYECRGEIIRKTGFVIHYDSQI